MAAAYASLVSLMSVIDQIQHHPSPPITLDNQLVESLRENITFLQANLALDSNGVLSEAAEGLESRIVEAACAAEDVIESRIVDEILAGESATSAMKKKANVVDHFNKSLRKVICCESTNLAEEESTDKLDQFDQNLQKVLSDFNLLLKEVMELMMRMAMQVHQLPMGSMPAGPVRYPSMQQKVDMVGFEDVRKQVLEKLTGHQSGLQIMSIVGMAGIGKTTLARNIYETKLITEHFHRQSWVTISQRYNVQKILLDILSSIETKESLGDLSQKSREEIGEKLHKSLFSRPYLIIMDDMWSIEVWDEVKRYFPDNKKGSRIMITTRMFNMAIQLTNTNFMLNFLDEDRSWKLLCKIVFGEVACPIKLENVGRAIAKSCEGLPLSITVISGLLAKSPRTQESWEKIAKNLKSLLQSEDDDRCAKILHTSYDHLPIHVKPCFLYMGIFPEDHVKRVSTLIQLWIAEGFIAPVTGTDLEEVAQQYLGELAVRNLILIDSWTLDGLPKTCRMHDLLRDMCFKEGEKFFRVFGMHNLGVEHGNNVQRRVIYHGIEVTERNLDQVVGTFHSASRARSLIGDFNGIVPQLPFKLLRVLKLGSHHKGSNFTHEIDFQFVNVRFLCIDSNWFPHAKFPSSMHLYWNLQTLIINGKPFTEVPREIWKMYQLKHVTVVPVLLLPDPPPEQEFGQWNLQSLSTTFNFKFSDEVIKRIPNVKKLKTGYSILNHEASSHYGINNINHFQKLESFASKIFKFHGGASSWQLNLNLPHSLKKLKLVGDGIELRWEDVTENLGSLPLLQVLRLGSCSFQGSEWNLVEGKFCNLRILAIIFCETLEYWVAESIHFPRLEQLQLGSMSKLTEIPSGIGDIGTLHSIRLFDCPSSVITSARKIQEEQEEFGNDGLKVEIVSQS